MQIGGEESWTDRSMIRMIIYHYLKPLRINCLSISPSLSLSRCDFRIIHTTRRWTNIVNKIQNLETRLRGPIVCSHLHVQELFTLQFTYILHPIFDLAISLTASWAQMSPDFVECHAICS